MPNVEKKVDGIFSWFGKHKTFTTVLVTVVVTLVVAGWAVAC